MAQSEQKRAQIRRGAVEVFLSSGIESSTMDQVACAAQVSKQTLYAYYRSKDELAVDVMSGLLQELEDRVPDLWNRPVTNKEDLRESLTDLATTLTSIIMRDHYLQLIRLFLGELIVRPELGPLWRNAVPMRLLAYVGRLLRRAQEAEVVRDVDLELATRMFVGPIMSYVVLDGLSRPGDVVVPDPSRLRNLVDLYLEVVTL